MGREISCNGELRHTGHFRGEFWNFLREECFGRMSGVRGVRCDDEAFSFRSYSAFRSCLQLQGRMWNGEFLCRLLSDRMSSSSPSFAVPECSGCDLYKGENRDFVRELLRFEVRDLTAFLLGNPNFAHFMPYHRMQPV